MLKNIIMNLMSKQQLNFTSKKTDLNIDKIFKINQEKNRKLINKKEF